MPWIAFRLYLPATTNMRRSSIHGGSGQESEEATEAPNHPVSNDDGSDSR